MHVTSDRRKQINNLHTLVELRNEIIDMFFMVSSVPSIFEESLRDGQPPLRAFQFERPEKVICLSEMWTHICNLMHKIFYADYPILTKRLSINY
jgi:hypothetical protein